MAERIKHTAPKHPEIDVSLPVDVQKLMGQTTEAEDCYTFLWEPGDSMCNVCASFDMCGLIYNTRIKKKVAAIEKEKGGYLDSSLFECIDRNDVKTWLKHKPRTGKQFVDMIQKVSNCPDRDTCKMWCSSFIQETKGVSIGADKIIIVK